MIYLSDIYQEPKVLGYDQKQRNSFEFLVPEIPNISRNLRFPTYQKRIIKCNLPTTINQ